MQATFDISSNTDTTPYAPEGEASNTAVIHPTQLSVTPPCEVARTKHQRQNLAYRGTRIQILLKGVNSDCVKLINNEPGYSYEIPVESCLRSQLDAIEHFAQRNVDFSCLDSPPTPAKYKPLWRGDDMIIQVAPWCRVFQQVDETGGFVSPPHPIHVPNSLVNITVEVPYIYIGPHKNGEHFSVSLSIIQMVYYPATTPSLPIKTKTAEKKGRPRKENVGNKATQESVL